MEKLPKARNKMDVPKKEEKKLTDEEIVKALECCTDEENVNCEDCPLVKEPCAIIRKYALDLIQRLQSENEHLKCNSYTTSWKGNFFEAKKEFERLTEENSFLSKECNQTTQVCVELQKQVDELKDRLRENLEHLKQGKELFEMSKAMVEQAVKDTAKEMVRLVEFHSVATVDENGIEQFSISALGLKEILHENFGVEYDELYDKGVEVE